MENDLSLIYGRYFEQVSQAFNAIRDDFRGDDSAGSTDSSDFPSQVRDFFNSLIQSQLEPEPQPQPQPEPMPGYGYGYDYGYDYGYYGGGEVVVETKPRICTKDMFRCPDGSLVSRDENCNFRPCPEPQQSPRIYRRGIPGFLIPTPGGGTEWVPEFGYGWNKYGVWAPKLTENSFLEEDYGYGGEEVVVAMSEPEPIQELPTATNFLPFGDPLQLTNLPYNENGRCNFRVLNSDYFYQGAPSFTYQATDSLRNFITTPLTPPEYQGDGVYTLRDSDEVYFSNRYTGTDQFPLNGWEAGNYIVEGDYVKSNCPADITVPIFEKDNPFRIVSPGMIRNLIDPSKL
jgi:hypothetical protein